MLVADPPGDRRRQQISNEFEISRTVTNAGCTQANSIISIISAIESAKSHTGTETIHKTVCTSPKIDTCYNKVVSFVSTRPEQIINSGTSSPKGITVFELSV